MKISVIVPVYNCERYLRGCLDSILGQSYKNLEILLIDDGSKDKSPQICDEYAKKDSRIIVVHQDNHGVSYARNQGLKRATGELIAFVDGDDTLDSDMYEFLLKLMIDNGADIAHCGYKHIYSDNIKLVNNTKQILVHDKDEALRCLIGGYLFSGGMCNKLIKKQIVGDISFAENIKINEDVLFCFKVFMNSQKSVFADFPKYNYLAHESSTAKIKTQEKSYADRCLVNKELYEQLEKTELSGIAASRYLSSLISYYRYSFKHNKKKAPILRADILSISTKINHMRRNLAVSVWLIHYCPAVYRVVYFIYDKLRKPNWDIPLS